MFPYNYILYYIVHVYMYGTVQRQHYTCSLVFAQILLFSLQVPHKIYKSQGQGQGLTESLKVVLDLSLEWFLWVPSLYITGILTSSCLGLLGWVAYSFELPIAIIICDSPLFVNIQQIGFKISVSINNITTNNKVGLDRNSLVVLSPYWKVGRTSINLFWPCC